jgi:predicted Zn-dependent peptidase
VADRELVESRENLKGTIMLNLESSYSRMANLARKELAYGRQFSLEEVLDGIDRVTVEDLHRLAAATFRGDEVTLTAVGPAAGLAVEPADLGLA